MNTEREENYLIGVCLADNNMIETVAKAISTEEFSPHRQPVLEIIFRLWVKEPKTPINIDRVLYAMRSTEEFTPDLEAGWRNILRAAKDSGQENSMTVESAAYGIHKGRTQERATELWDKLAVHKENLVNEFAVAIADKLTLVMKEGIHSPKFSKLIKTLTDPPRYELIISYKGVERTLEVETAVLFDRTRLRRKIFEHFDQFPDFMPGGGQLELLIERLARRMDKRIVYDDKPDTLIQQDRVEVNELIEEYLDAAVKKDRLDEMEPRAIYVHEAGTALDFRDLQGYISSRGVRISNGKLGEALVKMGFSAKRFGSNMKRLWERREEIF